MTKQITEQVKVYRVCGITDEIDVCDCCGRKDLKSTVEMMPIDADGNDAAEYPQHFGQTCAARAARWTVVALKIEIDRVAQEEAARKEEVRRAAWDLYSAWLQATYGKSVKQPADLMGTLVKPLDAMRRYRAETGRSV